MTSFASSIDGMTEFGHADGRVWLKQLCGLACGVNGQDGGFANARGLLLVDTDQCRFEADSLPLAACDFRTDAVRTLDAAEETVRTGAEWMRDGVIITLPGRFQAAILELRRQ